MSELATDAAIQAMSTELADAIALLKEHQTKQGIFHCSNTLVARIRSVMGEYESIAVNSLSAAKQFRDRMIIDLRALSMVAQMTDNASTHREKSARLRGLGELIESAISRLEKEQFDIAACGHPQFDDVFRSDYPTRHYVERIHQLENEIEEMNKADTEAREPSP